MSIKYTNAEWQGKKVLIGETEIDRVRPVNLLLGFHGAESTPENILVHGNRLQLNNAITVYPEGPVDAGEGLWSWWEDGPRQKETVTQFLKYTAEMIEQAHRHLADNFSGVPFRTCLWGFSQGGAAALVYTLFGSHSLHKVASVCGFLPEIPEKAAQQPTAVDILGIYGMNDDIVPSFLADHALDEMKAQGHKLTARETPQGHEINQENLQDLSDFFNS